MRSEEIIELLQFSSEHENSLFMPNEIFEELKSNIDNSPHITFTYSYIYFIHWQYRYIKHMSKEGLIDNSKIKEILGYNPDTKGLDYITKKNGLTDKLKYTETVKNIPISWEINNYEGIHFTLLSDYEEILNHWNLPRKYSIKYPVRAFKRFPHNEDMQREYNEGYEDGIYYDITNSHKITFDIFIYCMSNSEIGATGFYLYSFIKRKNDYYNSGWDISIDRMPEETGLSARTVSRYIDILRKYKMITVEHNQEYFCLALEGKERKANTYIVNDYDSFTYKPIDYEKMKVITTKEYYKKREDDIVNLFGNKPDILIDDLPY